MCLNLPASTFHHKLNHIFKIVSMSPVFLTVRNAVWKNNLITNLFFIRASDALARAAFVASCQMLYYALTLVVTLIVFHRAQMSFGFKVISKLFCSMITQVTWLIYKGSTSRMTLRKAIAYFAQPTVLC